MVGNGSNRQLLTFDPLNFDEMTATVLLLVHAPDLKQHAGKHGQLIKQFRCDNKPCSLLLYVYPPKAKRQDKQRNMVYLLLLISFNGGCQLLQHPWLNTILLLLFLHAQTHNLLSGFGGVLALLHELLHLHLGQPHPKTDRAIFVLLLVDRAPTNK